MNKSCKNCQTNFEITDDDLKFYEKVSPIFSDTKYLIPPPTLCPDCRQQRRLVFRNERNLYKRKCSLTGKDIISAYSNDKTCSVIDQEKWWSDSWDAMEYGREYNFSRPFFEQYLELSNSVPRPALINMSSENSLYTNHSAYNKNSYMCVNTGYSEDCYYISNYCLYNKDCVDCFAIQNSELCYFCIDIKGCHSCEALLNSENCTDCSFGFDLRGCKNCFTCSNLRNKQYCINNKQYSKEEYDKHLDKLKPKKSEEFVKFFDECFAYVKQHAFFKALNIQQCEGSSGNYLFNNRNVKRSFNSFDNEDCAYCYDSAEMKDCYDITEPFKGEKEYETHASHINYNLLFSQMCYENDNLMYCHYCWYSSNLFGCFGLKRKKYCIFNKQYTKDQYEVLVPKIVQHMIDNKEYGEFFPVKDSPFAYNETIANDYYPLTKEQVEEKGFLWAENTAGSHGKPSEEEGCKKCGKKYVIISQEKSFYEKRNIPHPIFCHECRFKIRFSLRADRKFYNRNCNKCNSNIPSCYSEEKAKKVLCESCYLKEVY